MSHHTQTGHTQSRGPAVTTADALGRRLRRVAGQVNGIEGMLADGRPREQLLFQLAHGARRTAGGRTAVARRPHHHRRDSPPELLPAATAAAQIVDSPACSSGVAAQRPVSGRTDRTRRSCDLCAPVSRSSETRPTTSAMTRSVRLCAPGTAAANDVHHTGVALPPPRRGIRPAHLLLTALPP